MKLAPLKSILLYRSDTRRDRILGNAFAGREEYQLFAVTAEKYAVLRFVVRVFFGNGYLFYILSEEEDIKSASVACAYRKVGEGCEDYFCRILELGYSVADAQTFKRTVAVKCRRFKLGDTVGNR